MFPTLHSGDIVIASSLPYFFTTPKTNDIIICIDPRNGKIMVKRIAKIDIKGFVVAGDNPGNSTDSRVFGHLNRRDIIGKVIYIKKR